MTLGQRLRMIRNFRRLTMEELGISVGFSETTANVRIAQYESDSKKPKVDMVKKLAAALNCSYLALSDFDECNDNDFMMILFWLEESDNIYSRHKSSHSYEYTVPKNIVSLYSSKFTDIPKIDNDFCDPTGMEDNQIAIKITHGNIQSYLREWHTKKKDLFLKRITPNEYFEWKISWTGEISKNE